jgi:hypothetical protein
MSFNLNEVPFDVQYVWTLNMIGNPVGKETMDKCKAIMEKYPEWFPTYKGEELPRELSKDNLNK